MKISSAEQAAIRQVIEHGHTFGFGNLISHLQTAWARLLIEKYDMSEKTARQASGGRGYPFEMQNDIVERGEWDETGERYAKPKSKPRKRSK